MGRAAEKDDRRSYGRARGDSERRGHGSGGRRPRNRSRSRSRGRNASRSRRRSRSSSSRSRSRSVRKGNGSPGRGGRSSRPLTHTRNDPRQPSQDGPWPCSQCQHLNTGIRTACSQCKAPRSVEVGNGQKDVTDVAEKRKEKENKDSAKDVSREVPDWLADLEDAPKVSSVKSLFIPQEFIGPLIGKGGEVIKGIQDQSSSFIRLEDAYNAEGKQVAKLTITGNVEKCEQLITEHLTMVKEMIDKSERVIVILDDIPQECVGQTIGPGGKQLIAIREKSNCSLAFVPADTIDPTADPKKQVCRIRGLAEHIPYAEQLLRERVAEVQQQRGGGQPRSFTKANPTWSSNQAWATDNSWSNDQSWPEGQAWAKSSSIRSETATSLPPPLPPGSETAALFAPPPPVAPMADVEKSMAWNFAQVALNGMRCVQINPNTEKMIEILMFANRQKDMLTFRIPANSSEEDDREIQMKDVTLLEQPAEFLSVAPKLAQSARHCVALKFEVTESIGFANLVLYFADVKQRDNFFRGFKTLRMSAELGGPLNRDDALIERLD